MVGFPLIVVLALALASGCTSVSSSRPLSGEPARPTLSGLYLFTEPPASPYRTLGFLQISYLGNPLRGARYSDTELDPAVHGALVQAMHAMGAEAAILVDVEDSCPPQPATRPWALVRGAPPGRVDTRHRRIEVQAEIIHFVREETK